MAGPRIWYKTVREIVTLERMHRAFECDLMTYGMMKGTKKQGASDGDGSVAPMPTPTTTQYPNGYSYTNRHGV